MIYLNDGLVLLRDLQQSDIEKRIYWETQETEWKLWDGPWQIENLTFNPYFQSAMIISEIPLKPPANTCGQMLQVSHSPPEYAAPGTDFQSMRPHKIREIPIR